MTLHHVTEDDLKVLLANRDRNMGKGGESKTRAAGERSASTPSGLRGNRNHAETTTRALQNGPSLYAPYVNKWELNYSKVLDLELKVGGITSWKYAGITFTLAKKQYHKIDFIIGHNTGCVEIAQVKGYHPNMRAAIKGLKWAAQLYPMFRWTLKWWTGSGWDGKDVEV